MSHTSRYPRFLGSKSTVGLGVPQTTLEDIEDACRTAKARGWTKAQIASELRTAGATWQDGKLLTCHPAARPYLMTRLTVGAPSVAA
jgi:hypothetical protein